MLSAPPDNPISTSTATSTSYVTPAVSSKPTATSKGNSTGPIETSGVEGRGIEEVSLPLRPFSLPLS